jgi:hypothetical protein
MTRLILLFVLACGPSSGPVAPNEAAAKCVSLRTTLQLACVGANATTAAIDACRAQVQREHDCTAVYPSSDAGAE